MFSSKIQSLINSSSEMTAMKRAAELEVMIDKKIQGTQSVETPKSFSDVLKVTPPTDFKYQVQEPVKTTKTEIQRLVRDHYKQLYANKMDNLEVMDKFLK